MSLRPYNLRFNITFYIIYIYNLTKVNLTFSKHEFTMQKLVFKMLEMLIKRKVIKIKVFSFCSSFHFKCLFFFLRSDLGNKIK